MDTANRTYRTGTRLHQWARSAWRRIDLQKLAGDEMLRLNDVTGLNAALSILDGNSILYLRTEDHVPIRARGAGGRPCAIALYGGGQGVSGLCAPGPAGRASGADHL